MISSGAEAGTAGRLTRKELASRLGLGIGTLLFYERMGLLPPPERAPNGYRVYAERDIDRLSLILRAKELGLSLREVAELLQGIEAGLPVERLRDGIYKKVEELQRKIDELEEARRALLAIAESPNVGRCDTIEKAARSAKEKRDTA